MHQDACWWCSHATWSFTSIVICHRVLSMGLMSRARVKHKRAQVFEPHSLNSLPGGGRWRRGSRRRGRMVAAALRTAMKCATLQTPVIHSTKLHMSSTFVLLHHSTGVQKSVNLNEHALRALIFEPPYSATCLIWRSWNRPYPFNMIIMIIIFLL